MALTVYDRVKETSTTTGAGDISLAGAATQFVSFQSRYAIGEYLPYAIIGQTGTEWETGTGQLTASSTLARILVNASSNSDSLVSFSAGTKDVFVTATADFMDSLTPIGLATATSNGFNLQ